MISPVTDARLASRTHYAFEPSPRMRMQQKRHDDQTSQTGQWVSRGHATGARLCYVPLLPSESHDRVCEGVVGDVCSANGDGLVQCKEEI